VRPRLLDLFCGAGGAGMGYHRAGFDVVGVDVAPQPRYPFDFVQADATTYPLDGFDAIHASPPCQDHMRKGRATFTPHGTGWMLPHTRERLEASGVPWVIENVPGAPLRPDLKLCGCMFGLPGLRRERWFETSWRAFALALDHNHTSPLVTVVGNGTPRENRRILGHNQTVAICREAMGIDWMVRRELSQAIPPPYTELIGSQLLELVVPAAA
jgi:DNA (cytosine-5)-methyltransferase 1